MEAPARPQRRLWTSWLVISLGMGFLTFGRSDRQFRLSISLPSRRPLDISEFDGDGIEGFCKTAWVNVLLATRLGDSVDCVGALVEEVSEPVQVALDLE